MLKRPFVNQNLFHNSLYADGARACLESAEVGFGGFDTAPAGSANHPNSKTSFYASLLSITAEKEVEYEGDPMSNVYLPVFNSFETGRRTVAVLTALVNWGAYFENILPPNVKGILVVLDNGCDEPYTYQINGEEVKRLGPGDLHSGRFSEFKREADFLSHLNIADGTKVGGSVGVCFCFDVFVCDGHSHSLFGFFLSA